jgi:hypothetical protein
MRSSQKKLLLASSLVGVLQACSLINAYDDVKPLDEGGNDGGGTPDSSADGAPDSTGSDGGSDGATLPREGLLVVGGEVQGDAGKEFVLTSLDPKTGHEVNAALREKRNAAGIQYDGLRDLWYVFESAGATATPAPADAVTLRIRDIDPRTGVWTDKGSTPVPTPVSNDLIGVLREMLVYVAYLPLDGGGTAYQLVAIDTANPDAPAVTGSQGPLALPPIGLMTARSNSAVGGSVNLVAIDTSQCDGDAGATDPCNVVLSHASVSPTTISPGGSPVTIGTAQRTAATPGVGVQLTGPEHIVALPPTADAGAQVKRLNPANGSPLGAPLPFQATEKVLRAIAVSECFNTAFIVSLPAAQQVYAVPLNGGTTTTGVMSHAGQRVLFEPFTNSVVSPFKAGGGNFTFTAFTVSGTASAPVLTKRTTGWEPPADLQPNVVVARQPIPFVCK